MAETVAEGTTGEQVSVRAASDSLAPMHHHTMLLTCTRSLTLGMCLGVLMAR